MKQQFFVGMMLLVALALPPVAQLMESIMFIHMHMQMPMLVVAGFLMGGIFQTRFRTFFNKWNENGVPGILLFTIIMVYWMVPRTMDEALTLMSVEAFKFISLPFLAGVPLRDSWKRLNASGKNSLIIIFTVLFVAWGWMYITSETALCNNYLVTDQIILGWGFLATAFCMVMFLVYSFFIDPSQYEG
ncbi:hypothetical protein [Thalassobacillus hwangdonensis]|uniref:Uncharacterized protein n=1 Tax=Thalassobacillus hwangdonensis TaxID=546108 RepID=A0ABW3L0W8_9BACI